MAGRSCPPLGRMLESLREAEALGLLDEILVIGSERAPEGADIATATGVEWIDEADAAAVSSGRSAARATRCGVR